MELVFGGIAVVTDPWVTANEHTELTWEVVERYKDPVWSNPVILPDQRNAILKEMLEILILQITIAGIIFLKQIHLSRG